MGDKIEVGEYVRTKRGIGKVMEIKTVQPKMYGKYDVAYLIDKCPRMYISETEFIKHSKNIIKLIEKGDYYNGIPVVHKLKDGRIQILSGYLLANEDIKKGDNIVTKEQFNSSKYVIPEEK